MSYAPDHGEGKYHGGGINKIKEIKNRDESIANIREFLLMRLKQGPRGRDGGNGKQEEIFQRYRPLIIKLWRRYYVAGLEFADWEQEARVVIVRVLKVYQGSKDGEQFSGFLKQSLVNRILDLYRARKAHKRIPAGEIGALTPEAEEMLQDQPWRQPEELVHGRFCLRQLIAACSPFERQVLLSFNQGYSIDEVAERLQCTKRQVQSAMGRSRRKMMEIIQS